MSLVRDFSVSTITAGFVAALVGLTSSIAIVFSAARSLGADDAQVTSWVWALCMGMAALTIVPSIKLRVPIMVAYSTPGAAILATVEPGSFSLGEAIGAFIISGFLVAVVGFSGAFERMMNRIPTALVSALLAGVLTRFALNGFADAKTAPWLVLITTITYFVTRRVAPRYAVVAVLLVGVAAALLGGSFEAGALQWSLARPVFMEPSFTFSGLIGIAIPLFIVTMAGQNLPGVAAIRNAQYEAPISTIVGSTGVGSVLLAPFGGYALNLSAITAAICMEPAAHEDRDRRYTAAVANGGFYLVAGIFGTSITGMLNAFPSELVRIIAALALLPTIGNNLSAATNEPSHREAAMVTFLVTLSGVTIAKVGSPFWGAAAGLLALAIANLRPQASVSDASSRRFAASDAFSRRFKRRGD